MRYRGVSLRLLFLFFFHWLLPLHSDGAKDGANRPSGETGEGEEADATTNADATEKGRRQQVTPTKRTTKSRGGRGSRAGSESTDKSSRTRRSARGETGAGHFFLYTFLNIVKRCVDRSHFNRNNFNKRASTP